MSRVLLLEDSITIIKVVRLTFASIPGFEVDVARTREEATKKIKEKGYSALLCYAQFCQTETAPFLLELSQSGQQILVYTESNGTVEEFEAIGLKYFLKKPFHSDDLRRIVGQIIDNSVDQSPGSREFGSSEDEPTHAGAKKGKLGSADKSLQVPAAPPPPPPPPQRTPVNATLASATAPIAGLDSDTTRLLGENFATNSNTPSPSVSMDVESLEKKYRSTLSRKLNDIQTKTPSETLNAALPSPISPASGQSLGASLATNSQAETQLSSGYAIERTVVTNEATIVSAPAPVVAPAPAAPATLQPRKAIDNAPSTSAATSLKVTPSGSASSDVGLAKKQTSETTTNSALSKDETNDLLTKVMQKAVHEWLEKNATKILRDSSKETVRLKIEEIMNEATAKSM